MNNLLNITDTKITEPLAKKVQSVVVFILAFILSNAGFAQVNLIPVSDGGFENATVTLAANGWTAANSTGSAWVCSSGATPYAGSNSGYIASSGTTYGYTNPSIGSYKVSHLYRDIPVPSGITGLTLSFQLKSGGEIGADRLFVSTAPTSVTPVAGTPSAYGTLITGATTIYVQPVLIPSYTLISIHLPNAYSGTTVRLIFTWMNDGATQTDPNPSSIDDVSLTYIPVPPAAGGCGYTFTGIGSMQTYNVPIGCSQLSIDAWGGKGGNCFYNSRPNSAWDIGGFGGRTQATVTVTPSTTSTATVLNVYAGTNGSDGAATGAGAGGYNGGGTGGHYNTNLNGGGGGGASDVRVSPYGLANRLIVAGGGGGGGFNSNNQQDERGGNGGGTTAEAGYENGILNPVEAGQAGTPSAGGLQATGTATGGDGTLGTGGSCTITTAVATGGGGGGGYYGGGPGYHGGGGGGSSYAIPAATGVSYTQGISPYNGVIYITPIAPAVFTVTTAGGGGCPGPSPTVGLSGSQTDVNYQLYLGGTAVGSPVTGTGSAISFGSVATSGTYTVAAYYTGYSGCLTVMTGSASVSASGPDVSSFATAATSPCAGSASTVTITSSTLVSGTGYTVAYTLSGANTGSYSASMTFGTGSGTFSIIAANLPNPGATTITINTVTITATGCSSTPGSGNTAGFTVRAAPGTISGVMTGICAGGTTTLSNPVAGGTWSSGTSSVATINSSGVVSAVSTGTVVITYTTGCGADATATLTISAGGGAISGASSICVGATTPLSIASGGGTWSSSNSSIAAVNTSGVVTGNTGGSVNISYTAGCVSVWPMTIIAAPGTISGVTSGICSGGGTTTLSDPVAGGTWTSGTSSVATVNPATGVVTGVTVGSTVITYSTGCGTDATATVNISSGAGTISGATSVCAGSSTQLSNASGGGIWSSGNSSIATISISGVVTGVAAGTVTISYTAGCVATLSFTVLAAPGIISGGTSVCVGANLSLSNSVAGGTWSSGSAGVAAVGTTGVVTGASAGTATITYSTGCGTDATVLITVNPLPDVAAITGAATVCVGSTISLTDVTAGGTWTSSAAGIAGVSSAGVVTGVATGTATISYSVTNSCGTSNATKSITVNAANGGTITGADSVCKGLGHQVILSDNVTGGVWTSSSTSHATVDPSTGVVTGVSTGAFTITYVVTNTCGTFTVTHAMYVRAASRCTTGIELNENNGTELQVFPNPNAGTFTMKLLSAINEPVQVIVTNVVGEKVFEFHTATNTIRDINIARPAGIYFLTAITAHGADVVKVIIMN